MNKIVLLLALVLSPCFLVAQNVSFDFHSAYMPVANSIWKDTSIYIDVTVFAPGRVATVTASAGGKQITWKGQSSGSKYTGWLYLSGVPGDSLALVVSATDSLNNSGDTSIPFIYRPLNDPGVTISIDSLADGYTATPMFPLGARSKGNKIDLYYVQSYSQYLITSARDSLPVVDLSYYNGKKTSLKVVATDSLGRTAFKTLSAYCETSPYLKETFLNDEIVRDLRYNKALIADKATGYPVLMDLISGQRSAPLINRSQFSGTITPEGGAVLSADQMYEWRSGQIVFQREGYGPSVSGDYMMWRRQDTLIRRNRITGAMDSVKLPTYYRGDQISIGPTGLVTFVDQPGRYGNVYKYDSGRVTNIGTGISGYKWEPVTDGKNIIYSTSFFDYSDAYLYFYNGQAQTNVQLGYSPVRGPSRGMLYQMNTRYSAFIRGNNLFLRDSLGSVRQMTNFTICPTCNVETMLVLLNDRGDAVISRTDSGMYLIRNNGMLRRITNTPSMTAYNGEGLGGAAYDGSNFYARIGSRLFKLELDSVPAVHVSDFEKRIKPDSTLVFSPEDFTSHFSGPTPLAKVKFTALPRHGVLKNYTWVFPENTAFDIGSLTYLVYTPNSGYTGTDTVRWVPYNGIDYITDTATVLIHVTDSIVTVPQPVVTGLSSSYCAAADSQRVKIANLPAVGSGIAVEVLLDSTRVLPVAADSTFTINPAVLGAGRHHVSVTFSYDTIQQQLSLSFLVAAAVTPSLDVSVNVNPITTDTIPVVITATNVIGEGKQPLYTFAWDRNFINQLQLEGNSSSVTVDPAEFKLGDNVVYARVRTSDQCYTSQTGIDSIMINKTNITAVVDVDNPGQPVIIYPNPFREQISVNGLQATKTYILSLYDVQGKLLLHQRVVNKTKTELRPPQVGGSMYILRIYDEKAQKLIGAQKLVGY
jgi:hypothetical protein